MSNRWMKELALGMAGLLFAACAATSVADYSAILTNSARPEAERALDGVRKPAEVMAFYGVKRGDKVADLLSRAAITPRSYRHS